MTTRKSTPPADETKPDASVDGSNAIVSQPTGETPVVEPDHPMPSGGGSYIRQPDGSLVRQDEPEEKDA